MINLLLEAAVWHLFGFLKTLCTGEKFGVKASEQGSPQSLLADNTLLKSRTPEPSRAAVFRFVWRLRLWSLASRRPRPGPTIQSEVSWR